MSFNGTQLRDLPFMSTVDASSVPSGLMDTVWNITDMTCFSGYLREARMTADFMAGDETGVVLFPSQYAGPDGFVRLSDKVIVLVGVKYRSESLAEAIRANNKTTDPKMFFTTTDGKEYDRGRFAYEREKTSSLRFELCLRLHIVIGPIPMDKRLICPEVKSEDGRYAVSVYIHAGNMDKFFSRLVVDKLTG